MSDTERIMALLADIQRDTHLCVRAIHGGMGQDGQHFTGLLTELVDLRERTEALESQRKGAWDRVFTAAMVTLAAALSWLAGHK